MFYLFHTITIDFLKSYGTRISDYPCLSWQAKGQSRAGESLYPCSFHNKKKEQQPEFYQDAVLYYLGGLFTEAYFLQL